MFPGGSVGWVMIGACACSVCLYAWSVGAQSSAGSKTNVAQVQANVTARSNDRPIEAAGPVFSSAKSLASLKAGPNLRCSRIHELDRPVPELLEVKMRVRPAGVE